MAEGSIAGLATVIAAIIGWLASKWTSRKEYQYDRSALVTTQRFEKEFHALDKIVGATGELVLEYEQAMDNCPISSSINNETNQGVRDIRAALAANRLYIDYRDENGVSFCGVKTREPGCKGKSVSKPSPYTRCLDICRMIELGCKKECIEEEFDVLVQCVDCRLHSIETGTRDKRRLNRHKEKWFGISWDRDYWKKYDTECSREK